MAEAAAANFPKLCHGSLEHVLPQKNLEKMLVGGPITKPMDLAITLCPFLLIFHRLTNMAEAA